MNNLVHERPHGRNSGHNPPKNDTRTRRAPVRLDALADKVHVSRSQLVRSTRCPTATFPTLLSERALVAGEGSCGEDGAERGEGRQEREAAGDEPPVDLLHRG